MGDFACGSGLPVKMHRLWTSDYDTKKTSGRNLLFTLATGATGGTPEVNHDGTIRVSRESTDLEYWTVEDLELQKTYYLKGDLQNTIDPSVADCGVVYVQGDVRSDVQIYTNEQ